MLNKGRRAMDRKRLAITGALIFGCVLGFRAAPAGAVTLGNALSFAALSESGDVDIGNTARISTNLLGDVAGGNVTLGNTSLAGRNAIATSGAVSLGNYATVKGKCITAGGPVNKGLGAKCVAGEDTTGTNPNLAIAAAAVTDIGNFEAALAALAPTQTLGAVTLAASKTMTITDSVAGLNIIELSSLTMGNSSVLKLSGAPGDSMVLNITGNLSFGIGARVVLIGGISLNHVLVNVQGVISAWGSSTTMGTTLIAQNAGITGGSGARIDGALYADGDIVFGPNTTVKFDPSLIDLPGVIPTTLSLDRAAGFLLASTGSTETVGNVLVGDPGDFGGSTLTFGSNSKIAGDLVASASSGTAIKIGNYTKASGACITGGGAISLGTGASCGSQDTTGTNPKLALLAGAGPDTNAYAAGLAGLPVTTVLPAIAIAASHTQTISDSVAGLNVFQTPSITMGGSSTLVINGAATDIVVINVVGSIAGPGVLNLSAGFKISLTGGITADRVVFNIESSSASPAFIGGTSSVFNGTLVAPLRAGTIGSGATINGQMIFGDTVNAGPNVTATYVPVIPIPVP